MCLRVVCLIGFVDFVILVNFIFLVLFIKLIDFIEVFFVMRLVSFRCLLFKGVLYFMVNMDYEEKS